MRSIVYSLTTNYNYSCEKIYHSFWNDNNDDQYWFKNDLVPTGDTFSDNASARRFTTNCSLRNGTISKTISYPSDKTYYSCRPTKFSLKLFVGDYSEDGVPNLDLGLDIDVVVQTTDNTLVNGYIKGSTNNGDVFRKLDIMEQDCPWSEAYLKDLNNYTGFAYQYAIVTSYTGGPTKIIYSTLELDAENHKVTITFTVDDLDSVTRQYYYAPYEYRHYNSGTNLSTAYKIAESAQHAAEQAQEEAENAAQIAQNIQDTFDQIDVNGLISI